MDLLVNIDVPDLPMAERFYVEAFGLRPTRRFGDAGVELEGWPARVYLLVKAAGTPGAGNDLRRYERHWSPVHFDVVVEDLDTSVTRAVAAGATLEVPAKDDVWGRIAMLADPFGHGFCLVQFLNRGYDEITTPA